MKKLGHRNLPFQFVIEMKIVLRVLNAKTSMAAHPQQLESGVWNPGQCGSVGWSLPHRVKGHRLDSQSRHKPGLQVQSPVGMCMRGNQSMFLTQKEKKRKWCVGQSTPFRTVIFKMLVLWAC